MGVILKSNIKVDDIKMSMDKESKDNVDRVLNTWGKSIPIIKIGEYVLNIGELIDLTVNQFALNGLPTFSMTIDDTNLRIRKNLRNLVDTCVIFIGYRDFFIKFNGIVRLIDSDAGDSLIFLEGSYYNKKLYNTEQKSYKNLSITEVFKDICSKTDMGLFVYPNEKINNQINYIINTQTPYLQFISETLRTYTTNLFSFDTFGYLHVTDIESVRKMPYDKYTLNNLGEIIPEHDIIFTSKMSKHDEKTDKFKIPIEYYTIKSNFSKMFLDNAQSYAVSHQGEGELILKSDANFGFGNIGTNTFAGFKNHKFPFYTNIVNKSLGGNSITITLRQLFFEVTPFTVVGFECYLPASQDKPVILDEEHSGKKIVISASLNYEKAENEESMIIQKLTII